jgi:hypothetical protein
VSTPLIRRVAQVRDRGELVQLDTFTDIMEFVCKHATLFVSHQWLGFEAPDPANVHYPAIIAAATEARRI